MSIDRFADQDRLFVSRPGCRENCRDERPYDNLRLYLPEEDWTQAQVVKVTFHGAQRVVYEQADSYGRCVPGARCSRAVITWVDDHRALLDRPQVIGRFRLDRQLRNEGYTYSAYVPVKLLSGGGVLLQRLSPTRSMAACW